MRMLFCVYDRIELLPYFLRYYQRMGITTFVCGVYKGIDSPLYEEIAKFGSHYSLELFESFRDAPIGRSIGSLEIASLETIRQSWPRAEWHAIADLDEFFYFPRGELLSDVIRRANYKGYDAIQGMLYDRIAQDGGFPPVGETLDSTYPMVCELTKYLGGNASKIVLVKSDVELKPGHHHSTNNIWAGAAHVHHFKWINSVGERIRQRYELYSQNKVLWANQNLNLLKIIDASGKIPLTLPGLNVRTADKIGI